MTVAGIQSQKMSDNAATEKLEELIKKIKEAGICKDDFIGEIHLIFAMDAYGSDIAHSYGGDIVELLELLLVSLD